MIWPADDLVPLMQGIEEHRSAKESDVTSSSITIQWGAEDCIHCNGDLAFYSVWYGVKGSGST